MLYPVETLDSKDTTAYTIKSPHAETCQTLWERLEALWKELGYPIDNSDSDEEGVMVEPDAHQFLSHDQLPGRPGAAPSA